MIVQKWLFTDAFHAAFATSECPLQIASRINMGFQKHACKAAHSINSTVCLILFCALQNALSIGGCAQVDRFRSNAEPREALLLARLL
jgi:hypothetical protein